MSFKKPVLIVTKFEIVRQLKKPTFWIALLLLPVLLLSIVGIAALSESQTEEALSSAQSFTGKTIGLLDEAEIIDARLLTDEGFANIVGDDVKLRVYDKNDEKSLAGALSEVKQGQIDIFYHLAKDFVETKEVKYYSFQRDKALLVNREGVLRTLLSSSAYLQTTPENALILTNGYKMTETTYGENGEEVNLLGQAIVPLAILVIFYILICVFGNRLLMSVVEEKENRISEMILTAVSAKDLIIGKIISLIVLGFLQIAVFIIPLLCILFINRDNPMVSDILSVIEWNPTTILMNIALLLFSYFFFAGACTFVGALVPTARDASQFIAPVMIGIVLPLYFLQLFISGENSALTYVMSYFPLTAPIALMLRNAFGTLPVWEFLIGIVELSIVSIVVLRLTVKTFQKNAINFSVVKLNFKPKKRWKQSR
ncbi:MAG: ABC transporter permease [Candidatus Saccharibacteria bacterium]|nr:ABC transporter permease [Candidatus Saccharibacteria bacterium]